MRLKTLFFLLALLLIVVWGILLMLALESGKTLFYVGEGVTTLSLIVLVYFYRKLVMPLNSIANGIDLLREQDFSSRLSKVGQAEADRIVTMFNGMMDQLKNERLRLREQNHFLDLLISVSPMGVIILDFDGKVSMLNAAALRFLGYTSQTDLIGKNFSALDAPLAEEINRLDKDSTDTIRLNDSMIYRCSRLSFVDRGFPHPFILIESLTSEVVKAEKKAYEKVIRMIAHEVNNTTAGITSTLETVNEALEEMDDTADLRDVMKVCVERCYGMSRFITNFANVVKIPDPQLEQVRLNDRVSACKRFMETICGYCPLRTGTGEYHQECGGKHRSVRRHLHSHVGLACRLGSGGHRCRHLTRGGGEIVQSLLLYQTQRTRYRTYLHPRSAQQAWLYVLASHLARRADTFPYQFS